LGAVFWAGIFYLSYRVLSYFQGVEGIGTILAIKLLTMIMVVFFSLLVFSNIITALSAYYLSDELVLLHSLPLSLERVHLAKFVETLFASSWMIVLFGMPVFGAYGVVYEASSAYYGGVLLGLVPLLVIAAAVGIVSTMLLVRLFPARRTKEILALLSILLLVSLYLLFRFLQPERLFDEAVWEVRGSLVPFSAPVEYGLGIDHDRGVGGESDLHRWLDEIARGERLKAPGLFLGSSGR
jgi:ABC-2 type transport system permease protein